jgi:regulator of replication initiation timing
MRKGIHYKIIEQQNKELKKQIENLMKDTHKLQVENHFLKNENQDLQNKIKIVESSDCPKWFIKGFKFNFQLLYKY